MARSLFSSPRPENYIDTAPLPHIMAVSNKNDQQYIALIIH